MNEGLVAALGALAGILVGGVTNYFTNLRIKNHEWKLAIAEKNVAIRQKLYAELLVEAQRLVLVAVDGGVNRIGDFESLGSKLAEVQLVSTEEVTSAATDLCDYALQVNAKGSEKPNAEFFQLKMIFIQKAREDIQNFTQS